MKTIILDGSNIIRNMYNTQLGLDFDKEKLLADSLVRAISCLNENEALRVEIYFDGPKREIYHPKEPVSVFFSKKKKADDLIVNSVFETKDYLGGEVLVITTDNELINRCKIYGAQTMRTSDFLYRYYDAIEQFGQA